MLFGWSKYPVLGVTQPDALGFRQTATCCCSKEILNSVSSAHMNILCDSHSKYYLKALLTLQSSSLLLNPAKCLAPVSKADNYLSDVSD